PRLLAGGGDSRGPVQDGGLRRRAPVQPRWAQGLAGHRPPHPAGMPDHTVTSQTPMSGDTSRTLGDDPPRLACRRCGRASQPARADPYDASILPPADPSPPVFTEDDLALDVGREIRRLVAQINSLDAQQAQDQVYRRLIFRLCNACYHEWMKNP